MTLLDRNFEADVGLVSLECVAVRSETADAKTYVFKREDEGRIPFSPGQFLNFSFAIDGREEARCYSISSSAAHDSRVAITVKRVNGGVVSNWLYDHFRPGHRVNVSGATGVFVSDPRTRGKLLFLSAGSGITPVASMMRTFGDYGHDADVVFLHFAQSPEKMIFRDEMAAWARLIPRARVVAVASEPLPGSGWVGPTGRLNVDLLKAIAPDFAGRKIYACGPVGFIALAREICLAAGVTPGDYHEESFDAGPQDESPARKTDGQVTFNISFQKSGKSVECASDLTLLKAAQHAKIRIQTSCGKGICGTCRVRLVSGTVEMNHGGGIKQREIDQGFVLACCSKATSDLVVEK